jgi:hypothetical protein
VHAIAFLLIIAMAMLAPLTMVLAVRRDPDWRPIAVVSVGASALVVFLLLPWGHARFVLVIVTLFGWDCLGRGTASEASRLEPSCACVADERGALTAAAL